MVLENIETFDSLLRKYGHGEDDVNVSFGVRPSGIIHLGNLITLALASGLTNKIGPHKSRLNITVCDLDLPSTSDLGTLQEGYTVHYRDIPDPKGEFESLSRRATVNVEEFMRHANKKFNIPFDIRQLSDVQRDPNFRSGLKRLLDDPSIMELINPIRPDKMVEVYPLCLECGTSYTGTKKRVKNTYEGGVISTHCANPRCSVKDYEVDVLDTSSDLSVHFFVDPLRDAVVEPFSNIHVFGGDYVLDHGVNKIPKIEKIARIIKSSSESGSCPDFLVGPTVYARDGLKMSKRFTNGLDLDHLKDTFGEDYAIRVMDFALEVVNAGYSHVDYPVVERGLLSN